MRRTAPLLALAAFCLGSLVPGFAADQTGITVFAAASTTDTVTAIAKAYQDANHVTVTCSFGSSSTLAKQIEQGAPADIFISADQKWMDYLVGKKAIQTATRLDLLGNRLVIIAPKDRPIAITPEKNFAIASAFTGRLAVGDPASVPAGIYAKEAFTALGWWDAVKERLAPAADVRAALKLVELGETDAGVVYATDAQASTKVAVAAIIPEELHKPIRYPAALTATAKPDTAAFLAYLQLPAATAIFTAAGFTKPEAMAQKASP